MRTSTLLVLLGLIALATSYTVKQAKPFKLNAEAIEKDEGVEHKVSFGDLVKMFQTHTFQDNTGLVDFLESLKQRINDEHDAHLQIYTQQKSECSAEETFRTQEIADAQASESAAASHEATCQSQLDGATADKARDEALQAQYQQQLEQLDIDRQEAIATYNSRRAKLLAAQAAIHDTLGYLDDLELEAGFNSETPALIQKVNVLLALSVAIQQTHSVLPVYQKLLQSHTRGVFDINDIDEVRTLLHGLADNVANSITALDNKEAADKETYDTTRATLVETIDTLGDDIEFLGGHITKMSLCVSQEHDIEVQASGKITRNQNLLELAQQICADAETEWNAANEARANQIHLLDQLEQAVKLLEAEYGESLLPDVNTLISVE